MASRTRTLSDTEIGAAVTCEAAWDFQYGGRLAGTTLKSKHVKPFLSAGRAWGAMVATWHANAGSLLARMDAISAMRAVLDEDYAKMEEAGVVMIGVLDKRAEMEAHLEACFSHYITLCDPLPNLTRIEGRLDLPIPARTGKGSSSRYRFEGYLDGFVDEPRGEWLWECKFRGALQSRKQMERTRQYRRYAWARQRETGEPIIGIIIEERLNKVPKPPKIVLAKKSEGGIVGADGKRRRPSHDADQLCTAEAYLAACREYDVEPVEATVNALRGRKWQQRVYLPFRPSELDEAGLELVSAAQLIRDLDTGRRYPIRNGKAHICNGCWFRDICTNPRDSLYVDTLFARSTPKRDKPPRNGRTEEQTSPTPVEPNGDTVNTSTEECPF